MPCNCDHLDPSKLELEYSRVLCMLEEVRTQLNGYAKRKVDPRSAAWRGFHPMVYNKGTAVNECRDATAKLCELLQKVEDPSTLSLEVQTWWRDHQAADRVRLERELAVKERAKARNAALKKLTAYERKLLGLS